MGHRGSLPQDISSYHLHDTLEMQCIQRFVCTVRVGPMSLSKNQLYEHD